MVQGDGSGQDLRPHLVVEVGGRDGVADGVGRPVRRAIRSPTEQIARLLTESFDADHDDPVKVVEKPLTKTAGTRTPLVLLAYVAAAAEENFDTMTRRRAHQPALTARWLSLVVIRVPRTDVETVVRDEAVTTANEDDPPDDEQPKSAAHRGPRPRSPVSSPPRRRGRMGDPRGGPRARRRHPSRDRSSADSASAGTTTPSPLGRLVHDLVTSGRRGTANHA